MAEKKRSPFGPWYVKVMAVLGLAGALGLGKPWELVAFAGEVKEAVEASKESKEIQKQNAELHQKYDVLNAAQETKIDMLSTILLQNARNGGPRRSEDRAMDQQMIVLAERIASLNTENGKLKAQLKACEEKGDAD